MTEMFAEEIAEIFATDQEFFIEPVFHQIETGNEFDSQRVRQIRLDRIRQRVRNTTGSTNQA